MSSTPVAKEKADKFALILNDFAKKCGYETSDWMFYKNDNDSCTLWVKAKKAHDSKCDGLQSMRWVDSGTLAGLIVGAGGQCKEGPCDIELEHNYWTIINFSSLKAMQACIQALAPTPQITQPQMDEEQTITKRSSAALEDGQGI